MNDNVMFLIRFYPDCNSFVGWNSVFAKNIEEAKEKLLKKVGSNLYKQINWDSLLVGQEAEAKEAELENFNASLFY